MPSKQEQKQMQELIKKWDYRNYQQEVQNLQKELRLGTKTGKYTCAAPLNRKKK